MFLCAYDWPQEGTKQIAYANAGAATSGGNGGHIIELFVGVGGQPPWSWADLTTITGAPLADELSRIAGYAWPAGNTKQVVYTSNAHIIELSVGVGNQPPWSWLDLTAITGAPAPSIGAPSSAYVWSAENTKQVVYTDANGHIIELFVFVGGQWSWADLTTITGAPLSNSINIPGYDWPAGNTKQVVYIDENRHIVELSVGAGGQPPWSWADLTTITGAPLPLGGLAAYSWSAENTKQVVYIGDGRHIIELFKFVGSQWSWADLTTITGAPLAPFASELVAGYDWPAGNTKQVVYVDANFRIIELSVGVGGQPPWSWADLTTITGALAPSAEGENIVGYAWSGENTKQVVHLGRDETLPVHDRLIELYAFVGGQWSWADLTTITGATLGL